MIRGNGITEVVLIFSNVSHFHSSENGSMPEKNDANKLVADKRTAASPGKVAVKKVSAEKSPAVSPGNVAVKRMSAENASPAPPGKAENRKLSSGITPIEKEAVAKNLPFFAIPTG